MKKLIFLLLLMLVTANVAYAEDFTIKEASVNSGDYGVSVDAPLIFEYSHRIDPFDIEIVINGGDVPVSYSVAEGKKLVVSCPHPLKYETLYHISVNNVRDIYEGRKAQLQQIVFKTEDPIKILLEESSVQTGTYIGKVKNMSDMSKEVVCVVTAKDPLTNEMFDYKAITAELQGGEEISFTHTFTNISLPYKICAYTFSDFSKLIPADRLNNENNY